MVYPFHVHITGHRVVYPDQAPTDAGGTPAPVDAAPAAPPALGRGREGREAWPRAGGRKSSSRIIIGVSNFDHLDIFLGYPIVNIVI